MRWFRIAVPLGALGVVAHVANANASVPSFTRQTGLACNQCHMTWTPNPDMTFTGTKFRMNGYRSPFIAEKLEAGEEGALNGNRLVLGLQNYLSFHFRSLVLQGTKSSSDPALPEPNANPLVTQPHSTVAWDYAGPIGEHVGFWHEQYSSSGELNVANLVTNDEYDLKLAFNPGSGGNIVGVFMNTQSQQSPFFGAFSAGVGNQQRSPGVPTGHAPYANLGIYGWLNDRVALQLAVQPGEDNLDYKRMNYGAVLALLPLNTDAMWGMFTASIKAGNDMVPQVSTLTSPLRAPSRAVDAIRGVSATRISGQPYASVNTGDATRLLFDWRFGFLDKGHWSVNTATALAIENETYDDNAKIKLVQIGASWRFFYDRTYGVVLGANKRLTYDFTDASGVVHDVPTDVGVNATFVYRMMMNFAWELSFANTQALVLDQNWRNGYSWGMQWHWLF